VDASGDSIQSGQRHSHFDWEADLDGKRGSQLFMRERDRMRKHFISCSVACMMIFPSTDWHSTSIRSSSCSSKRSPGSNNDSWNPRRCTGS
jgi:hypothetical protein